MPKSFAISIVLVLWLVSPAAADSHSEPEDQSPHYIDLLGGYAFPDNSRGTKNRGYTGTFIYGAQIHGPWWVEGRLQGSLFETGSRAGTDFYQWGGGVDLVGTLGDRESWTPFALVGVGAVVNDVQPNSRDDFDYQTNAGVGLITPAFTSRGLKLRAEGRILYDAFRNGQVDYVTSLGISIPLGRTRVVERVVEREVIREIVREVPAAAPAPPPDSDFDGVYNPRDLCPNTLRGALVDENGCIVKKQTLVVEDIHFEFDSNRLTPPTQIFLDGVADSLREQDDLTLEISGHTDSLGSDEYNQRLSQARAESVRNYLNGRGVRRDRVRAKGYGESRPIDTNQTEAGRARNRRVEFRLDAVEGR